MKDLKHDKIPTEETRWLWNLFGVIQEFCCHMLFLAKFRSEKLAKNYQKSGDICAQLFHFTTICLWFPFQFEIMSNKQTTVRFDKNSGGNFKTARLRTLQIRYLHFYRI